MNQNDSRRRPTMRDVAEQADVSFKTVSRVVNGEGGVSELLAQRVHDAIRRLGYRPDDRARHLRQGRTTTGAIGFIMVDVANPFFSSTFRGIEEVARARGSLVLAGSNDGLASREEQLVDAFVARRVDGFIVVPASRDMGPLRPELDRGTPVVFLDLEPADTRVDLVRSDHYGGARRATEHLLAHGHREIAFFGDDPAIFSAGCRLDGFLDTMRAAGLDVPSHRIVTGSHRADTWRSVILDRLRGPERATALFTAQNFITIGATRALHHLGLHHHIAHVGFDDIDLADIIDPGISVVPQHPLELGRRSAELLFRRIDGDIGPAERQVVESALVERGSGEIRPAR